MELLKSKLLAYVAANNREWNNVAINIDKIDNMNSISLIVAMERMS
jgi:hypothetical protein